VYDDIEPRLWQEPRNSRVRAVETRFFAGTPNLNEHLIYDVGFHNGDDTAYYLHRGFNVLAVEANPTLVAESGRRFESEIASRQLTLLNVAIAESEGFVSFWVNQDNDTWSSFDQVLGCRHGSRCQEVKVRAVRFASLLGEYGIPYYLKVDIEGSDALCIRGLDPDALPKYVSCELTHDENALGELYKAGYRRFKVLNQTTYTGSIPVFNRDLTGRLLRRACHDFSVVRSFVHHLPQSLRPKKIELDNFSLRFPYKFTHGSSGPFGEETYGPWYSFEDITKRVARIRRKYLEANVSQECCWYDVHATR
jgi:FkbM family methyltransferase